MVYIRLAICKDFSNISFYYQLNNFCHFDNMLLNLLKLKRYRRKMNTLVTSGAFSHKSIAIYPYATNFRV